MIRYFSTILVLSLAAFCHASDMQGIFDFRPNSTIILSGSSSIELVGVDEPGVARWMVGFKNSTGDLVTTQGEVRMIESSKGVRFKIAKTDRSIKGIVMRIQVPKSTPILFKKPKGAVTLVGFSGPVTGKLSNTYVQMTDCSGPLALEGKQATLRVSSHMSESEPFSLKLKKGNVRVELGQIEKVGPGKIVLGTGKVEWVMTTKTALRFQGFVRKGVVICNVPIQQSRNNGLNFSSMAGQSLWNVVIENGTLKVDIPKPSLKK